MTGRSMLRPSVLLPLAALVMPFGMTASDKVIFAFRDPVSLAGLLAVLGAAIFVRLSPERPAVEAGVSLLAAVLAAAAPLHLLGKGITLGAHAPGLWVMLAGAALALCRALGILSAGSWTGRKAVVAGLFGAALIYAWEAGVRGFAVPSILLPAPSAIFAVLGPQADLLWADFQQTVLKAVLRGYLMGCLAGFVVAVIADRVPFLARGLLPFGNLISAIPIVGIAPIMVMWFGFDWPSKAAVVVVVTFFPMLVNTLSGLAASDRLQMDLMRSYAAGYWRTLVTLRLPNALPFLFNALKINSTLALIGAIVAEFFGTPVVGMGFRISTEVSRMNLDIVWATILVAAVTGSVIYGVLTLAERTLTAWHPSARGRD